MLPGGDMVTDLASFAATLTISKEDVEDAVRAGETLCLLEGGGAVVEGGREKAGWK